ncbi:hypothetical protein PRIPAC_81611, partial [Pristionchus pacificus]|uniref:G protein-coupled receptor n=1 Tax=Pristionchus pacificus TaxID=54126 RepID=A0A2A6BXQ6_PRIPA
VCCHSNRLMNGQRVETPVHDSMRNGGICIAVNASQGAFNCILLIAGLWTHALSDGYFLAIVYGPVKYAPMWLRDIVTSLAVFMVFSLWQFITAPCIVQYLVLFRKSMPNAARVGIAYLFTAISMGMSVPYFWIFVPYSAIVEQLRTIARRVQLLTDDDTYVVYGIGMREDPANGNRTAFGLAFYGIAPSYSLTYAVFGFTVLKIVRLLGRVNTELSIKTIELQRGFVKMQVIQGFIPLVILTIPFATFITFIFTGANLDNWTLMLTFSQWSLPAVQAIVYLKYLVRARRSEEERNHRILSAIPNSSN